jgi:hypothetical protein
MCTAKKLTRPTIKQRLDYKQIILDCQIRRLTDRETLEYFHLNGINDISLPTLKRYKTQIRQGAQKWIASLARSRRAEYIAEYRERIDEILRCQKELWNIYNDENTNPSVKVMAVSKIMDSTMKLTELYDALPIIAAIRNFDNDEEHPIVRAVREKDLSHISASCISAASTNTNEKDKDVSSNGSYNSADIYDGQGSDNNDNDNYAIDTP